MGELAYRQAAFAEPLACCIHAVDQVDLESGDTVVIIGHHRSACSCPRRSARAALERSSSPSQSITGANWRSKPARTTVSIPWKPTCVSELDELVDGVDIAVEAVGLPETIEIALSLPSAGGTTLIFGVPPQDATVEIDPFSVYYDETELVGTYSLTPNDFSRAVTFLRNERIRRRVTHHRPSTVSGD